jgi:hypothetical protein
MFAKLTVRATQFWTANSNIISWTGYKKVRTLVSGVCIPRYQTVLDNQEWLHWLDWLRQCLRAVPLTTHVARSWTANNRSIGWVFNSWLGDWNFSKWGKYTVYSRSRAIWLCLGPSTTKPNEFFNSTSTLCTAAQTRFGYVFYNLLMN